MDMNGLLHLLVQYDQQDCIQLVEQLVNNAQLGPIIMELETQDVQFVSLGILAVDLELLDQQEILVQVELTQIKEQRKLF